ncbi:hypothetical protein SAMN05421787_1056 [Virgibacillus pantothenticus]|nr:hypothetical protein SAMN05421787_1056 [Virgibacillus pantothenticus]
MDNQSNHKAHVLQSLTGSLVITLVIALIIYL